MQMYRRAKKQDTYIKLIEAGEKQTVVYGNRFEFQQSCLLAERISTMLFDQAHF